MAFDKNLYKKYYEDKKNKSGDPRIIKFEKGDVAMRVRILPATKENKYMFSEWHVHYINMRAYTCPQRMSGSMYYKNVMNPNPDNTDIIPCPICRYNKGLYATGNPADKELASSLKCTSKWFFNVIVRGSEADGVRILPVGVKLFDKILDALKDESDDSIGDFTDIATGYDLNIIKKELGGFPDYSTSEFVRKSTPLSVNVDEAKKWLEGRHNLVELIPAMLSYAELTAVLNQTNDMGAGVPQSGTPFTQVRTTPAPIIVTDSTIDIIDSKDVPFNSTPQQAPKPASSVPNSSNFMDELSKLEL
jgi:hypothetical protein